MIGMTVWGKHCFCELFIEASALFKCDVPCQARQQHCIMQAKLEGSTIANKLRSMLYVDLIGSQAWCCCVCSSAQHNASACNTSIQSCLLHMTLDDAARKYTVRKSAASVADVRNQSCECFVLHSSYNASSVM